MNKYYLYGAGAGIAVLLIGGLVVRSKMGEAGTKIPGISQETPQDTKDISAKVTLMDDRVRTLEDAVTYVLKKFNNGDSQADDLSSTINGGADPTFEGRLKLLETTVADLKSKITPAPGAVTPTATSSQAAQKYPLYIPLGSAWTTNEQNGLALPSFEVTLDPADYPGYSNMYLEVNMRLTQKSGTAYALLYNMTDSQEISSSQVSTTSDQLSTLTSSAFKLPVGKKTYRLKVRNTSGIDMNIQFARIKVVF